jgi:hypothetical protein
LVLRTRKEFYDKPKKLEKKKCKPCRTPDDDSNKKTTTMLAVAVVAVSDDDGDNNSNNNNKPRDNTSNRLSSVAMK